MNHRPAVFERYPLYGRCLYEHLVKAAGRNCPSTQTPARQTQSRRQSPLSKSVAGLQISYDSGRKFRTSAWVKNPILANWENRWSSQFINVESNAAPPNAAFPCADASMTRRETIITCSRVRCSLHLSRCGSHICNASHDNAHWRRITGLADRGFRLGGKGEPTKHGV